MNVKIKKRHKNHIEITEDGKCLSVKALIIEAAAHKVDDQLKVIITYSNGTVKVLNKTVDNIILDIECGGGYTLKTEGPDDDKKKQIKFSYCEMMLGRIQWFRYEINTDVIYGKIEMEILLT